MEGDSHDGLQMRGVVGTGRVCTELGRLIDTGGRAVCMTRREAEAWAPSGVRLVSRLQAVCTMGRAERSQAGHREDTSSRAARMTAALYTDYHPQKRQQFGPSIESFWLINST